MTLAEIPNLAEAQHLLLEDASWELYQQFLQEYGDTAIRMTYDNGRLEIMSPLPEHGLWDRWIARLVDLMCLELAIAVECLGTTTFANKARRIGFEPDNCYYVEHAEEASRIRGPYNPRIHPPPDFSIEIDITSRSIEREPIYAAFGVPELWRFDGKRLAVLHLNAKRQYAARARSLSFPFLPMQEFEKFVLRKRDRNQLATLREFQKWVRSLSPAKK